MSDCIFVEATPVGGTVPVLHLQCPLYWTSNKMKWRKCDVASLEAAVNGHPDGLVFCAGSPSESEHKSGIGEFIEDCFSTGTVFLVYRYECRAKRLHPYQWQLTCGTNHYFPDTKRGFKRLIGRIKSIIATSAFCQLERWDIVPKGPPRAGNKAPGVWTDKSGNLCIGWKDRPKT